MNWLKKIKLRPPGWRFSRHPDFREQEYFTFWPKLIYQKISETHDPEINKPRYKSSACALNGITNPWTVFLVKLLYPYSYWEIHCVKSVRIRGFSGPHFPAFWLNTIIRISPYSVQMRESTDQNNSKYGHFLRSVRRAKIFVWNIFLFSICFCCFISVC